MCNQSLAHVIASIFSGNNNLAIMMTILVTMTLIAYNTYAFKILYLPKWLQILTEFVYLKYNYHSLLILFYGLGRCPERQQSIVLIQYDLEDDERLFWKYFHYLLIYYCVLTAIHYLIFKLKSKNLLEINCFNFVFVHQNDNQNIQVQLYKIENNEFLTDELNKLNKMIISWIKLSYFVTNKSLFKSEEKVILNKINGYFESNSLNAIMGPSGAGKTTLLKCLSGWKTNGLSEESKIFIYKRRVKSDFIVQNISDRLLEGLTVRQTLLYASKLKNSRIIQDLDHNKIVSDLMSELLISDTADNRVESCSGGEQKRIVIASELTSCNKPDILFIDEPTSGLDSNAAEVVIQCLKRLSRSHQMTIIVSIHQPNQDLFQIFDKIYVLAKGGIDVFSGYPQNVIKQLNNCQIECKTNEVPIEELLRISSDDSNPQTIEVLNNTTKDENKLLYENCLKQNMYLMNEKPNLSKRFSFKDLYHLLLRTMTYSYKCQWKTMFVLFIIIQALGILMKSHFDADMIKPSGCLELEWGGGCNQTLEEINEEYLIKQNLKFNMSMMIATSFVVLVVFSITFCQDYRTFRNEQKNGKTNLTKKIKLTFYSIRMVQFRCFPNDQDNCRSSTDLSNDRNLLLDN